MTVTIGFNILSQYVSNRAQVEADAARIGGQSILVMDDVSTAQRMRARFPLTVHRRYQSNGAELYKQTTPEAWVSAVAGDGVNGVLVQCHNEPFIDGLSAPAFVDWNIRALREARARGVRLAVGTFAVGNPHESLIAGGAFDALLRELRANEALMVHEYFLEHPTAAPEYGWLCGRVEYWTDRMKMVGSACKTILVAEYGKDKGGGITDGWRHTGWTASEYASKLVSGLRDIYKPLSDASGIDIHPLIFCVGTGAGMRWDSFNIEGVQDVYNAMQTWNAAQVTAPPPVPTYPAPETLGTPAPKRVAGVKNDYVNVRAEPTTSAPVVGQLVVDNVIDVRPGRWVGNGYTWAHMTAPVTGWFASNLCTLEDVDTSDTLLVRLDVPYVSQTGTNANQRNNDCLIACVLMVQRYYWRETTMLTPTVPSVNDLVKYTSLASSDKPLALSEGVTLFTRLGLRTTVRRDLVLDAIVTELQDECPPVVLVNYAYIGGQNFGHFVVPVAVSEKYVWVNDPYLKGANYRMTRAQFEQAISQTGSAGAPYQGIVLAEAA